MSEPTPIPGDIDRIVSMAEDQAILRNLLITQRYHDLSQGLREAIDPVSANWATFATWGSNTAGQWIRGEEIPRIARARIAQAEGVERRLAVIRAVIGPRGFGGALDLAPVIALATDMLARVGMHLSAGNHEVFAEIGPLFARYIHGLRGRTPDPARLAAFVDRLAPGPIEAGGQDLLRRAFTAYHAATSAPGPAARARFMLMGNMLITLHEQTRLQPHIRSAIDAPLDRILDARIAAAVRAAVPLDGRGAIAVRLEGELRALAAELRAAFRRLSTRFLMGLVLPRGERMPLGEDVAPRAGERLFPAPFVHLTDPPELVQFRARYDRSDGATGRGSAAIDWASLDDRMSFIFNLYRARQLHPSLFDEPFAPEKRAAINRGELPSA